MFSLPSLRGRVNGHDKLNKIKEENSNNVGDISIVYNLIPKKDTKRPVYAHAIHAHDQNL